MRDHGWGAGVRGGGVGHGLFMTWWLLSGRTLLIAGRKLFIVRILRKSPYDVEIYIYFSFFLNVEIFSNKLG